MSSSSAPDRRVGSAAYGLRSLTRALAIEAFGGRFLRPAHLPKRRGLPHGCNAIDYRAGYNTDRDRVQEFNKAPALGP
jgi:hypothetical protein